VGRREDRIILQINVKVLKGRIPEILPFLFFITAAGAKVIRIF
jgi:hypothetical protein